MTIATSTPIAEIYIEGTVNPTTGVYDLTYTVPFIEIFLYILLAFLFIKVLKFIWHIWE